MDRPSQRRPDDLPDPWLFDSERLLAELDRVREITMNIPISDPQSTHFGINRAVNALWDLQQTIRFLLLTFRQQQHTAQHRFAKAHTLSAETPPTKKSRNKKILHLVQPSPAPVQRQSVTDKSSAKRRHWRTTSHAV